MKILLSIIFAATILFASGQRFALLDKGMLKPIKYVDSVKKEDLKAGYFPIYKSDIDSILPSIKELTKINKAGLKRQLFENIYSGNSAIFEITNIPMAYGDRYDISLISITDAGKFTLNISSSSMSNPDNQIRIKNLYNYLTKGKLIKIN